MSPALTRLSADGSLASALEVFDTDGGGVRCSSHVSVMSLCRRKLHAVMWN